MTEYGVVSATPEEPRRHPGLGFQGLYQVIVNPSALFAKIKEDPKILVPYITLFLAAAGLLFLLADYIVDAQMQSEAFQKSMEQRGGTAGQMNEQVRGFITVSTIGVGSLAMMLAPLLIAGLAAFWGNFVFAGRAPFKAVLSVTLFGEFLYVLGEYAIVPLVMAKNSMTVGLSLATLLPNPKMDSVLWVALSKISVFHIWELIVLGIGFSIIYDFSRNKGMWMAVLSMGLLSILHVITTAIGSMFA